MFNGPSCRRFSKHSPEEEQTGLTHQKTKFIGLGLIHGIFVPIPIQTPWGVDKNAPIGIVGGVGVYGV